MFPLLPKVFRFLSNTLTCTLQSICETFKAVVLALSRPGIIQSCKDFSKLGFASSFSGSFSLCWSQCKTGKHKARGLSPRGLKEDIFVRGKICIARFATKIVHYIVKNCQNVQKKTHSTADLSVFMLKSVFCFIKFAL